MSYERERQVAIEAVTAASRLCEAVRQSIPTAMEKDDRSPVTVADFGAQAIICRALHEAFPEDAIVGEEDAAMLRGKEGNEYLTSVTDRVQRQISTATPQEVMRWIDLGNGKVGDRFWTLDPIDGTKGFLRQDQYAIALALIEDGEVKLGVLGCPALSFDVHTNELGGDISASQPTEDGDTKTGVLFEAVRGRGTTLRPIKGGEQSSIRVQETEGGGHWRLVESVEGSHSDLERQAKVAKAVGLKTPSLRLDSQAKYGALAWGLGVLYLRLPSPETPDYREKIWDHAAGAIVVEEAGGRVTDMHGKPLDFSKNTKLIDNQGVVASNGKIHDAVIEALK
mgnify:CR=1 FL=1